MSLSLRMIVDSSSSVEKEKKTKKKFAFREAVEVKAAGFYFMQFY